MDRSTTASAFQNDDVVPQGEAIRLVVWDLDETLWHGTLTEGGIQLRAGACDIIKELPRRGILNSICSKNDPDEARVVLEAHGLWEYFVFPSIDWTSKGPRLRALLDAIQLRPESALFIDDNHGNRAEALHYVPGLRVASEAVIPHLLASSMLRGKDDPRLDRLTHYRILQGRRDAQSESHAGTDDSLRSSEIEIVVEHELDTHADRIIELINRTNQLNFTKIRFPEDPEAARAALRDSLASHFVKAGLIRVRDKFGDYGHVGLYMLHHQHAQPPRLLHFCFSCRILNMGVETWLYNHLGRPALQVAGDVLTDLATDTRTIDWIRIGHDQAREEAAAASRPDYVLLRGGCDIHTIAHYFRFTGAQVFDELHSVRGGYEPTISHSIMLRHAILGTTAEFRAAAAPFGYVEADFASRVADPPAGKGIWLFSFAHDQMTMLYRYKPTGELLPVRSYKTPFLARTLIGGDPDALGLSAGFLAHLEDNFEFQGGIGAGLFAENIRLLFGQASPETSVVVILGNELARDGMGQPCINHANVSRNGIIKDVAQEFGHVLAVPTTAFTDSSAGSVLTDHWDRETYFRLFGLIMQHCETA